MSKRIRDHLRGNVVGYVAIFLFAMSATAIALPGTNTVFSDDIVNGEVTSPDILDNTVGSVDLRNGGIQGPDVGNNALGGNKISNETVRIEDIDSGAVASDEILNETITTNDLQSDSVQFDEIQDETIGVADIGPGAVGASEVGDQVVQRNGTPVNVAGGAAENGAYVVEQAFASCNAGEELIGGTGFWTPNDNASGDFELWVAEVTLSTAGESIVVDGGNDSGVDHTLTAQAVCLTV